MSYCDYVLTKPKDDHHRIYHDLHYGTPIEDDNELFGRLILEIISVVEKRDGFFAV